MKTTIEVHSDIVRSPRVMQIEGIFDIPPSQRSAVRWEIDLPIEQKPWNIGLIVGPSGCGKSTLAKNLFAKELDLYEQVRNAWAADRSLLDSFPREMGAKEVVELLNSVGFSSPPSWVRPFHVLSNGEQFRVMMARVLAETPPDGVSVVDEFTSVVDRTVAQIGSNAVAKTIRRRSARFIAITCHEDVEAWLQPDWVYRPHLQEFQWRELRRRPSVKLSIRRVSHTAWKIFARHHYLTSELSKSAVCFCAFIDEVPVAFHSYLPFVGRLKDSRLAKRGHRSVCLPDYQGIGIGNALITTGASMWAALGFRVFRNTAHPAEIAAASRSKDWRMIRTPQFTKRDTGKERLNMRKRRAATRLTASFEYVGQSMDRETATKLLNSNV